MDFMVNWLYQTGWKILVIAGFCGVIFIMIRRFAPIAIRRTVWRQMKGKRKVEKEQEVGNPNSNSNHPLSYRHGNACLLPCPWPAGNKYHRCPGRLGNNGVAVGFAAQYLIRDYISGFFILLENQYNVGDVIRVGSIAGIVEHLSIRRTILRDLDGALHIISNGEIRIVSNLTKEWSRAHLNISVAYKEDLDRVMALMRKTWEEMTEDLNWGPHMIAKTPWLLRVDEFGSSGITIKMVGETEPIKQWDVMGEYRRRIKRVFDQEGIKIPWPHVKLYYDQSKPTLDDKEAPQNR